MKISTRFLMIWALLLIQVSAFATDFIVQVGDNFYSPQTVNAKVGDRVIFQYVGQSSHPTASDNGAWATFPMNATATTKTLTFSTLGNFFYHCTAHGGSGGGSTMGFGQAGLISVSSATPAEQARPATPTLSVYPNPSKGLVTVALGSPKVGTDYQLRLSNLIGREVKSVALKPELAGEEITLNLTDLPAGIYFYSLVVSGKVVATKRLVLQN